MMSAISAQATSLAAASSSPTTLGSVDSAFLSASAIFSALSSEFPCRTQQIQRLLAFFYPASIHAINVTASSSPTSSCAPNSFVPPCPPPLFLSLFGPASTAKSSLVSALFRHLQLPFATINLAALQQEKALGVSIVNQIRQRVSAVHDFLRAHLPASHSYHEFAQRWSPPSASISSSAAASAEGNAAGLISSGSRQYLELSHFFDSFPLIPPFYNFYVILDNIDAPSSNFSTSASRALLTALFAINDSIRSAQRRISFVFISRGYWRSFLHTFPSSSSWHILPLPFPAYTEEEMLTLCKHFVLADFSLSIRQRFPHFSFLAESSSSSFFDDFLASFLQIFTASVNDLRELIFLFKLLLGVVENYFESFGEEYETLGLDSSAVLQKLLFDVRPHCQLLLKHAFDHMWDGEAALSSLEWKKRKRPTETKEEEEEEKVMKEKRSKTASDVSLSLTPFSQSSSSASASTSASAASSTASSSSFSTSLSDLSLTCKFLLLSSYLASYNPQSADFGLFDRSSAQQNARTRKGVLKARATRRQRTKNDWESARLVCGADSFPLERWLSIFNCIFSESPAAADDQKDDEWEERQRRKMSVKTMNMVAMLVAMNLVEKSSSQSKKWRSEVFEEAKYRCLVTFEEALQISASANFDLRAHLYDV